MREEREENMTRNIVFLYVYLIIFFICESELGAKCTGKKSVNHSIYFLSKSWTQVSSADTNAIESLILIYLLDNKNDMLLHKLV